MEIMLPTATDNGARLAAILPSGLAALAKGRGADTAEMTATALGASGAARADQAASAQLADLTPALQSLVVVLVDGLGSSNLKARAGHAPTLSSLAQRRITTVAPSTTSAALTSFTTGTLPGDHGMVGYRIRHPELGLLSPLRDWDGIDDHRSWQLSEPLFHAAAPAGLRTYTVGRAAHAGSGLSQAILSGAEYVDGDRIEDRFVAARNLLRDETPALIYVYVDELDRAAHRDGWQGDQWTRRLEQLDRALHDFLIGLPMGVGVALTADHGMVDIEPHQRIILQRDDEMLADVTEIGGEPRFRSLYLREGADPAAVAGAIREHEGQRALVLTRDEAIATGMFGPTLAPGVAERLGEVLLIARKQVAYFDDDADPAMLEMVGQHGGLTDEERGIPLILAGALAGTSFAKLVEKVAAARFTGE